MQSRVHLRVNGKALAESCRFAASGGILARWHGISLVSEEHTCPASACAARALAGAHSWHPAGTCRAAAGGAQCGLNSHLHPLEVGPSSVFMRESSSSAQVWQASQRKGCEVPPALRSCGLAGAFRSSGILPASRHTRAPFAHASK